MRIAGIRSPIAVVRLLLDHALSSNARNPEGVHCLDYQRHRCRYFCISISLEQDTLVIPYLVCRLYRGSWQIHTFASLDFLIRFF